MKVLFVALLCIGLVAAFTEQDYQDAFTSWMQKYDTVYTAEEFTSRYAAFKSNMDFVDSWNKLGRHEVELNQFADLTNAQYQRIYLGTHIEVADATPAPFTLEAPLAATVDWTTKGAVTAIKDQGQCGSCWSFSTTGSVEGAHFLATGNLVSLSEQNLMDCSKSYGNQGCNGGLMDDAFKYIIANKGIDTEASYPYTAKDGTTCKYNAANSAATISKYTDVAKGSETDLASAVNKAPVSVAIDASKTSFQLYKTGVYNEPSCSTTRLDHGVLAVGYGSANSTTAYWIVKNSWGTSWGQKGYIWMLKDHKNQCGIATSASYPTA